MSFKRWLWRSSSVVKISKSSGRLDWRYVWSEEAWIAAFRKGRSNICQRFISFVNVRLDIDPDMTVCFFINFFWIHRDSARALPGFTRTPKPTTVPESWTDAEVGIPWLSAVMRKWCLMPQVINAAAKAGWKKSGWDFFFVSSACRACAEFLWMTLDDLGCRKCMNMSDSTVWFKNLKDLWSMNRWLAVRNNSESKVVLMKLSCGWTGGTQLGDGMRWHEYLHVNHVNVETRLIFRMKASSVQPNKASRGWIQSRGRDFHEKLNDWFLAYARYIHNCISKPT